MADAWSAFVDQDPGSEADAVAIGDVSGDGLPDVVLSTVFAFEPGRDDRVWVYLQEADGSLAAPRAYPFTIPIEPYTASAPVGLVDLDGDGVRDVVVGWYGGVSVLFADGTGGLMPATEVEADQVDALTTADFDG